MVPRFTPPIGLRELASLFKYQPNAVEKFELEFAKKFKSKDAVAFAYGRTAIFAIFKALGINDKEIILPSYTCSVVAHAVTLSGNRPSFVDINLKDYNMDLTKLSMAINNQTSAIIVTHLFGNPMNNDKLHAIVKEAELKWNKKIWIIQDCAHSFGAKVNGKLVCETGDMAIYGLNISKLLTSINGGMLTFNDKKTAEIVRKWRDKNSTPASTLKTWKRGIYLILAYIAFKKYFYGLTHWLQKHTVLLKKYTDEYHLDNKIHFPKDYMDKMTSIEARVGIENLKRYDRTIEKRKLKVEWYYKNLNIEEGWVLPEYNVDSTYSHFVVRVPNKKDVIKRYEKKGIELGEIIQYSVPHLPCYQREIKEEKNINSKIAANSCVNFPL